MKELGLRELRGLIPSLFRNANRSVDIMSSMAFDWDDLHLPYYPQNVFSEIGSSVRFRRVLGFASDEDARAFLVNGPLGDYFRLLVSTPWQARVIAYVDSFLVADKSIAIRTVPSNEHHGAKIVLLDDRDSVIQLVTLFEELWEQSLALECLYENRDLAVAEIRQEILRISDEEWQRLVRFLAANPDQLRSMDPRQFEELIAEMLSRESLEVHLTPYRKDGGRDILAFLDTPVGRHLYLVECKRFSEKRPVGVSIVRTLYGVLEAEKATAALLVTTSRFTQEAISFRDQVNRRLYLKDYRDLVDWLRVAIPINDAGEIPFFGAVRQPGTNESSAVCPALRAGHPRPRYLLNGGGEV